MLRRALRLKGCVQEEGEHRLSPSSTMLGVVCVMKLTCALFHHHHVCIWLKLCGHRHTTVSDDINEQNVVRGWGCGCFEVVVNVEGFATTTSLNAVGGLSFRCYQLPFRNRDNTEVVLVHKWLSVPHVY